MPAKSETDKVNKEEAFSINMNSENIAAVAGAARTDNRLLGSEMTILIYYDEKHHFSPTGMRVDLPGTLPREKA